MRVLDFAMQTERRGRDFYRRLAQKAESEGLRNIYGRMVEDEERIFRRMRELSRDVPALDSRALDGMKSPFDGALDEEAALRPDTEMDAYLYLMKVEESLCRLYEEAAEREPDPEVRKQLMAVASEAERELRELEATYDFINAPNEYLAWHEFSNLGEFHNFGRYEDNRECRHTG